MSITDLKRSGQQLLDGYFRAPYITEALQAEVLKRFTANKTALERHYGKPHRMAITRFNSDGTSLHLLPDELRVYRGYREPRKRLGISWSLSRLVAEGFSYDASVPDVEGERVCSFGGLDYYAERGYTLEEKQALGPKLITGTCSLLDVLAYTNIRSEQEIVIDPAKVRNIEELTPSADAKAKVEAIYAVPMEKREPLRFRAEPLEWLLSNSQH